MSFEKKEKEKSAEKSQRCVSFQKRNKYIYILQIYIYIYIYILVTHLKDSRASAAEARAQRAEEGGETGEGDCLHVDAAVCVAKRTPSSLG